MPQPFQSGLVRGEGGWALQDLARHNTYASITGYAAEGLHGYAFFERFRQFCGATILYLGEDEQQTLVSYVGNCQDQSLDVATAQMLYADTIGTLRTMAVSGLFAHTEKQQDSWPSIRATAITHSRCDHIHLIAAHLISAAENGDHGDTFLYANSVGEQIGLVYRDMIVRQLPDLEPDERERAQQVLGRGPHMQRIIACLVAGLMPSSEQMDDLSATYYQNRGQ